MPQRFTELFNLESVITVPNLSEFLINTVLLLILSQLLSYVYQKFGQSLTNRRKLAALFPLLAITTMMIITVIKSSIALSLGLVGALSIVRFRSAIKEPEELAYIFLTISLGLGMGAGERGITVAFFIITLVFVIGRAVLRGRLTLPGLNEDEKVYLEIITTDTSITLEDISQQISPFTKGLELKRLNQSKDSTDFYFLAWVSSYADISELITKLQKNDKSMRISVLNEETLFS